MFNLTPNIIINIIYYLFSVVCGNNVIRCDENTCTCKEGYAPIDCCQCLPSFIFDPDNRGCTACPTGQKPNNGQTMCVCESGDIPDTNGDCPGKFHVG